MVRILTSKLPLAARLLNCVTSLIWGGTEVAVTACREKSASARARVKEEESLNIRAIMVLQVDED